MPVPRLVQAFAARMLTLVTAEVLPSMLSVSRPVLRLLVVCLLVSLEMFALLRWSLSLLVCDERLVSVLQDDASEENAVLLVEMIAEVLAPFELRFVSSLIAFGKFVRDALVGAAVCALASAGL